VCPICKTNKNGKAVLIGIDGTQKDNIEEAMQVHLDCINLRVKTEEGIIYQLIDKKEHGESQE
jgi:hypothetical protein